MVVDFHFFVFGEEERFGEGVEDFFSEFFSEAGFGEEGLGFGCV